MRVLGTPGHRRRRLAQRDGSGLTGDAASASRTASINFSPSNGLAPGRALADGVIVTPTLLKLSPPPAQRLIGNLSNAARVLLTLARP